MVLSVSGLARRSAHRFVRLVPSAHAYLDDLVQYGLLGAAKAAVGYAEGAGTFENYASVAIRRAIQRGWQELTDVWARKDGSFAVLATVPLDEAERVAVPPLQEDLVVRGDAQGLYACIGERLVAHMRTGTRQVTRGKAAEAYRLSLEGESGVEIGRRLGCNREAARQLLGMAAQAVERWANEVLPEWGRRAVS
ncbi:sigma factor [Corallococcus sp. M7]